MLRALGKWMVVIALVCTIGGHWAFLQSVAWVRMAVSYSQTESISSALTKTFNGQNPCKLCKLVSAGKKADKQAESKFEVKKLESLALSGSEFYFPPLRQRVCPTVLLLHSTLPAPPTPPPLLA